ncbi:hypothetical protein DFH07DRAFT_821376 [Mycena maculata]|uniref:Uncharacterized protein n=1 Tax=Mycena maculata TaxID=230809 RepID=A0AAD7J2L4_9AGAR|nr:hypothetical protein DFH07DRAFT_821376 [Mycena maculata]
MSALTVPSSPAAIKKLEKQLAKQAKREDAEVKHALKDVQSTEKHKAKAQKATVKAEQIIEKIAKAETATLKALNKVTHQHDTVVVDLRNAERDGEMKRQEDEKLATELKAKKAHAAEVLQTQLAHADERKTTLRQLREGAGIATPESTLSDASSA